MSNPAEERLNEALDSLCESTGMPDISPIRAKELADSSFFQNPWFEDGYKLTTSVGRKRDRVLGIYRNSFSQKRSRDDEPGRISLNIHKRK